MLTDIMNYCPEHVDFVLTDAAKEKFPQTLFEGAKSFKEVEEKINEHFVALFPENEITLRKLDEFEVTNIREEYCKIQEDQLPGAIIAQQQAYEEAKQMKKDADDNVLAIQKRISELAARVKQGTDEMRLPSTETVTFALNGYNLTYTWSDGVMRLAKAEVIPEWGRNELWAQEDQNRQAMMDLFGLEFPEVKKPGAKAEEVEEEQNEDF